MLFNSYYFILIFFPICFAFYHTAKVTKHFALAKAVLLISSWYFYAYLQPKYLVLLIVSILFNFSLAKLLLKKKSLSLLWFGICVHLATLMYFKYFSFFINELNSIALINFTVQPILLPLAISFFTFQQIAYLVDIHHKKVRKQNLLDYSLFVSFFAQLIAGPIVHHKDIIPQLNLNSKFSWYSLQAGLIYFTIGLFKKVVIADTLAGFVDPAFLAASQAYSISFIESWGTLLSYTLQIYFDFSAYSDMAIGLGLCFQIELIQNFNSPYKAQNIQDFWRRWHISLSQFLKNYLYIPLGGNRVSSIRTKINLMVTMCLGGFWHGSQWTFVLWGALHGIYLLLFTVYTKFTPKRLPTPMSVGITFFFVSIAWVLFRSPDIFTSLNLFKGLFCFNGIELDYRSIEYFALNFSFIQSRNTPFLYFSFYQMYILALLLFIVFFAPNTEEIVHFINQQVYSYFWAIVISFVFIWSFLCLEQQSEFIYFRF